MIIATAPYIAGYRVAETKGQVFGLVVRSRGLGGNLVAGPALDRGRRDPRVHEPARGHPPPGDRPDGPERDPGRGERGHLDPLRLVGARRDDVRDRRLRDRRRDRPGVGRTPPTVRRPRRASRRRSSSGRWACSSAAASSGPRRPADPRRDRGRGARRDPAADLFSALFLFIPGAVMIAAVFLERTRYRSLHAEQTGDGHGPGGGEPQPPEPPLPAHRRAVRRPDDRRRRCRSGSTPRRASGGTSRSPDRAAYAPFRGGGAREAGWYSRWPAGNGGRRRHAPRAGSRATLRIHGHRSTRPRTARRRPTAPSPRRATSAGRSSTASCPGSSSTPGSSTRRVTPATPCSSG